MLSRASSLLAFAVISRPSLSTLAFTAPYSRRSFSSATSPLYAGTRYLLNYDYIPDVLEKRGPYREGHLGLANDMIGDGLCLSGGPTIVPGEEVPKGALFIFSTKEAAEKFVEGDPYVSNGIVTKHSIEEWNVVVGN